MSTSGTGSNSTSGGSSGSKGSKFVPPSTEALDAILDQYEFLEILGQGGMGAVYKARQKSLDRTVAIKILPPDLTSSGDDPTDGSQAVDFKFTERFAREARAMAKLSHPNIISVYDFGQTDTGQLYIVMEYVEGTDLHALIQTGKLTPEHVLGWSTQICSALQYAHDHGIIHRDIKPSNIMISRDSEVKIADFGLAKLTGAGEMEGGLTMTNVAVGTPDYIAPEALEPDTAIDHRADLYAVGVMLYEMLTGKVPRGSWKAPSTHVQGLDKRFDELVEFAMDANRDGRFQNATDIASSLYNISTTAPTAGQPGASESPQASAVASTPTRSSPALPLVTQAASSIDARRSSAAIAPPRKPIAPLIGVAVTLMAIAAGAYFLFRGDPDADDISLESELSAATPTESSTSTAPGESEPESPARAKSSNDSNSGTAGATDPANAGKDSTMASAPTPAPDKATPTPTPASAEPDPNPDPAAADDTRTAPLDPSAPLPPSGPVTDSKDLLALLSVNRDAFSDKPGEQQAKPWKSLTDGTLTFSSDQQSAWLAAPVSLAGIEDCEIEIAWRKRQGNNYLGVDVPVSEGRWVRVLIGTAGNKVNVGGRGIGIFNTYFSGPRGMVVTIRRLGTTALVVTINGKEIGRSREPLTTLAKDYPSHPLYGDEQVPVLFAVDEDLSVLEWSVRAFGGKLTLVEDPKLTGDTRLQQLEQGFQSAFDREANQAFLSGRAGLDKGFAAALERARKDAQKRGDLDEVVALRQEQQRIADGGEVPPTDAEGTPASLVALRSTYRTTHAKLESERDAKTIPLYDKYLAALTSYEAELTKSDDIDKAIALRDFRKGIQLRRSEIPGPEPLPADPATMAKAEADTSAAPRAPLPIGSSAKTSTTRKELANWLLSIGSTMILTKEDEYFNVTPDNPDDLPSGRFDFGWIDIKRPPATITDEDFERLAAAPELKHLEFSDYSIKRLPVLGEMDELESIQISSAGDLSDEFLADLGTRPSLSYVSWSYTSGPNSTVSEKAIATLAGLPSLENLWLSVPGEVDFDATRLSAFETTASLRKLTLAVGAFSPQELVALGKLKQLEEILLDVEPSVDDAALLPLAELPNLAQIQIGDLKAEGMVFSSFQCRSTLTSLIIGGNSGITDAGLGAIAAAFPNLDNLLVEGNNFGVPGIEKLTSLKSLTSLSPQCPQYRGGDLYQPLSQMGSLRSLNLFSNSISAQDFLHLAELSNLESLTLSSAEIDTKGFSALAKLDKLQTLSLLYLPQGIPEEWIPTIKSMSGLQSLRLMGSGLAGNDGRLQKLQEALPGIQINP